MICKYCGQEDSARILCGGVEIPSTSPIACNYVCNECDERSDDWFHDSDMEDR